MTTHTDLPDLPGLPAGLTSRPLTPDDAAAVHEVMAAEQQQTLGRVDIEEADIVADWARPSHDLSTQSVGVLDGGRLVGYAEVIGTARGDAAVHPGHHGRGIGTWLAHWMQDRARSQGQTEIGMPVPAGSATGSAGTPGCSRCPRAARFRTARCRGATRSGWPSPRRTAAQRTT